MEISFQMYFYAFFFCWWAAPDRVFQKDKSFLPATMASAAMAEPELKVGHGGSEAALGVRSCATVTSPDSQAESGRWVEAD